MLRAQLASDRLFNFEEVRERTSDNLIIILKPARITDMSLVDHGKVLFTGTVGCEASESGTSMIIRKDLRLLAGWLCK